MPCFQVVIGGTGNTYSAIRTDVGNIGETVKRVSTPGVLQCGKFEHLWVSWKDNLISAGQSSLVGSEPFIEWYAGVSMFPINAVGISSGLDFDGTFMFGNIKGQLLKFRNKLHICKHYYSIVDFIKPYRI